MITRFKIYFKSSYSMKLHSNIFTRKKVVLDDAYFYEQKNAVEIGMEIYEINNSLKSTTHLT